jgi:hypothetical protein
MISIFCDSPFAIGLSYSINSLEYIKQIKQRNWEQIYHQDNICLYFINKSLEGTSLLFRIKSAPSNSII